MQTPTTTISWGAIKINVDSRGMLKDTVKVMNESWLLKMILILLTIALVVWGIKWIVRRKVREARERKKAQIWKEEYKNK